MNCPDSEALLLAERDGVLTPPQHATLAAHLAACPACRQLRADLGEAMTYLKTDAANIAAPGVDDAWRKLRAQLRGGTTKPIKKRPLAPVIWFGAPLAAAAALALGFFAFRPAAPQASVESGDATVSTIAYVDKDSGWLVVWATESDTKSNG